MIRVIGYSERNVVSAPPNVIVIPAATATIVLLDTRKIPGEISQRFIQNTGANPMYFSEGVTNAAGAAMCDDIANYHGLIAATQQLDCSAHRLIVCVYSPLGTTVAVTIRSRFDQAHKINQG